MRSWIIGVLVGVLGLGGVAVWMVASGQETDAPAGAPSARTNGAAQELPGFDRPAAETRLAAEPTPLDPASGGPGDLRAAPAAAADSNGSLPEGEDVRFTGRVVDGARRPIEGATVSFVAEPMRLAMQVREDRDAVQQLPSTRTGRDGRFELPARVPFGDDTREGIRFELDSQQLVVRHEAFATLSQSLAQVTGPTHDVGELTLDPGAWLSGRAVDSDGRPVAGAEARASNTGERREGPGALLPFFGRNLVETLEAATTGADGRFTVRGLRAGQAALDVTKTGLRAGSRPELELTESSGLDVGDVTLEKGASIAGLVLDGEGRPLAGAEMSVSSMSRMVLNRLEDLPRQQLRQELGQRARTDESGRFELSGLAGGTYTVHANADGFEPLSQADVPAGTRDLRLSPVPQGGLLVRLTSTDGGTPIDGAAIDATPRQAERFGFGMRAREAQQQPLTGAEALAAAGKTGDPAGVYFVPHAGIEGTDLVVSAEGFATTALEAPGAPSGGVAEFAAQIAPESVVAGTVADPEGRPIARARLTLRSTADDDGVEFSSGGDRHAREMRHSIRIGDDERKSATRHSAVTGVDGRFELHGVAAGEWELGTRAKGFVRSEPQSLTLEDGRSQPDLQLVLQPAGWIAGTVSEPGGAPVAGASISVEPAGAPAADSGGDPMERQMARLESMVAGSSDARRARTDPRGAYRVGDLAPGEYTVRLDEGPRGGMFGGGAVMFAMDGAPQADEPGQYAKVEAGQETRVDFQRPERARLTGRVLAGGTPAPDVTVRLGEADRPAFMGGSRTATTDTRGHYEFDDVTAGRYEVSAVVPGAALEKKVPVELEAGQTLSADVVFGGSTLSGRVLEVETDRPAAGVNITVVPVVEDGGGGPQFAFEMVMVGASGSSGSSVTIGGGPEKLVRTDEQGRFEVRYLEAGQYRVEAGGEGFVRANPETLEVHDGENRDDVVLRVQRGAVLSGVVVDSATGQKLDKVPVRLEGDGAMEMTVTANGVYRFEGLQPGSYTVSVMGSGFFSDPLASEQVTLETGQEATLDLKTKASS